MNTKIIIVFMLMMGSFIVAMDQSGSDGSSSESPSRTSNIGKLQRLKRLSTKEKLSQFVSCSAKHEDPAVQIKLIYKVKAAIEDGDEAALKAILNTGKIDFTPKEHEYTSASFALLLLTAKMRRPSMCEMLLMAGANPNATSIDYPEGNTILSETIFEGHFPRSYCGIPEICNILLKYGAIITERCISMAERFPSACFLEGLKK